MSPWRDVRDTDAETMAAARPFRRPRRDVSPLHGADRPARPRRRGQIHGAEPRPAACARPRESGEQARTRDRAGATGVGAVRCRDLTNRRLSRPPDRAGQIRGNRADVARRSPPPATTADQPARSRAYPAGASGVGQCRLSLGAAALGPSSWSQGVDSAAALVVLPWPPGSAHSLRCRLYRSVAAATGSATAAGQTSELSRRFADGKGSCTNG